jgi:hypothetical protein
LGIEPIALTEALIQKVPDNAKQLSHMLGVPYAFGSLAEALVDRGVFVILHLAYETGLL